MLIFWYAILSAKILVSRLQVLCVNFYSNPNLNTFQENGGCGFFEWCDQPSVTDTLTTRGPSYSVSSSFPELSCPCGSGTCLVLTAKTGKNIGQQFYRCPSNQVRYIPICALFSVLLDCFTA